MAVLACIVEGHGETTAFPVLVRRIAHECGVYDLHIPKPIRSPKSKLLATEHTDVVRHLDRVIRLAVNLLPNPNEGALLVSLDADESCPKKIAESIRRMVSGIRDDVRCEIVLPKMEFESWFLAALPSLATHRGLAPHTVPDCPEGQQGAKQMISRLLFPPDQSYSETVDQQKLSAVMSLQEASKCRSFRHFLKTMESVLCFLYPSQAETIQRRINDIQQSRP
ncbi:MAG: DUF4276 family protein [Phycisphaerae bacterium]